MIDTRAILAVAVVVGLGHAAAAQPASGRVSRAALQQSCWPAADLAVRPGEAVVQRGVQASGPVALRQPYPATMPIATALAGSIRRVTLPK